MANVTTGPLNDFRSRQARGEFANERERREQQEEFPVGQSIGGDFSQLGSNIQRDFLRLFGRDPTPTGAPLPLPPGATDIGEAMPWNLLGDPYAGELGPSTVNNQLPTQAPGPPAIPADPRASIAGMVPPRRPTTSQTDSGRFIDRLTDTSAVTPATSQSVKEPVSPQGTNIAPLERGLNMGGRFIDWLIDRGLDVNESLVNAIDDFVARKGPTQTARQSALRSGIENLQNRFSGDFGTALYDLIYNREAETASEAAPDRQVPVVQAPQQPTALPPQTLRWLQGLDEMALQELIRLNESPEMVAAAKQVLQERKQDESL